MQKNIEYLESILNIIILYIVFVLLYFLFKKFTRDIYFFSHRKFLEHQKNKKNIPTYGGIIIIFSLIYFFHNPAYIGLFLYGIIGFIDDFLKQRKKYLSFTNKMALQIIFFFIIMQFLEITNVINLFFFKFSVPLFLKYIFCYFVVVGTSNGVNIADGMDGLAAKSIINLTLVFIVSAFVQEKHELLSFLFAFLGSMYGFLTFNSHRAKVIMGDSGALGIGAMLGIIGIQLNCECIIPIGGIYFLVASLSTILQVCYMKLFGKRLFLMAPIHHSFEKKNYDEFKIVESINIFSFLFSIIGIYIIIFHH